MPRYRVFISSVMWTHELDRDRETARSAIENLGVDYSAFAFPPVTEHGHPPNPADHPLDECNILLLLAARTMAPLVRHEFDRARILGMPRCVFLRDENQRSAELSDFLNNCGCRIIEYAAEALTDRVSEYFASLQTSERAVTCHTVQLWHSIVEELARDPQKVFQLQPRRFEELVARLIAAFGYETTLTPQTRDGGYDIVARRIGDPLFPTVHLVEANCGCRQKKSALR
jgi:hypothetical protein